MKRALVCGAGGFIGGHLVKKLKREGYWVRGVDRKLPEFAGTEADEFKVLDLRDLGCCWKALSPSFPDEVYQLAADMGGVGYIDQADCEIMRNSALINLNMTYAVSELARLQSHAFRYFFSSSVCVYRDLSWWEEDTPHIESFAYPANPDNEYGWEKLYAERVAEACGRRHSIPVRIARFENCYGPGGTWQGGREKAPAAICRKVAEAEDGSEIEVWGDGTAVRVFTYVDDLVDGIYALMHSDLEGPVNLGSDERVTVADLARTVIEVSGKKLGIKYVPGPVGVHSRNFSKARMKSLGWEARVPLREGIERTYQWVEARVKEG